MHINTNNITADGEVQEMIRTLRTLDKENRILSWGNVRSRGCHFSGKIEEYTLKPEPKLRPWTKEEAIGKGMRHKQTGNCYIVIAASTKSFQIRWGDTVVDALPIRVLEEYVQLDGSPCGTMEED